jgi:hypothetical protein
MKYAARLVLYIAFFLVAMVLAPLLPAFAVMREGPVNNANGVGVEPRLPSWLFWFDTSTDNSLWGDTGWRTMHCPEYWGNYWGMVLWLWRNPACGFAWHVVAHAAHIGDVYTVTSSGCGLDLDKSHGQQGWFLIQGPRGAFQYRYVKQWRGLKLCFEAGNLLDVYVKDAGAVTRQPLAPLIFQPQIKQAA